MKKNLITGLIFSFIFNYVNGQNPSWLMGLDAYSFLNNSIIPANSFWSSYGHNIQCDINGNVVFSIFDGVIVDANGVDIGSNAGGGNFLNPYFTSETIQGISEYCIVPVPGSCTQNYIISGDKTSNNTFTSNPKPYYVQIDLSLYYTPNNNYGQFIIGPIAAELPISGPTHNYTTLSMGVTSLRTGSNDRYLFVSDNSYLYKYKISSSGISDEGPVTTLPCSGNGVESLSELEIFQKSNGNYVIAVNGKGSGSCNAINVVEVSSAGTFISSTSYSLPYSNHFGLEFSPNGNILYVSNSQAPYLQFVNLSTGVINTLNVNNAIDFKDGQIEIGYDQKLYFAAANRLASLDNPDNPITGNWNDNAIPYSAGTSLLGMNSIQDQIDGEDYLNPFSSTPECCSYTRSFNINNHIASTGNNTWTANSNPLNNSSGNIAYIKGTITIPSNAHVIIEEMELHFALDGEIIVQNGGILEIKGSKLTGDERCQTMWQGITVEGTGQNGSADQSNQGQLFVYPDGNTKSKIEEAIHAVLFSNGGFVNCDQVLFESNYEAIKSSSHNSNANYQSEVKDCWFSKNSNGLWYPKTGQFPLYHLYLNQFNGNDFQLTSTPGGVKNIFQDANYAIFYSDVYNVDISNSDFINCKYAIYASLATT